MVWIRAVIGGGGMGLLTAPVVFFLLPWKRVFLCVDSSNFLFFLLRLVILASVWVWGKSYLFLVVLLRSSVCFLLGDIFSFFIVFEVIVFPMAIYISVGKTGERTSAILFFILYTLCTSIPFFVGLVWSFSSGFVGNFSLWGEHSLRWLFVVMVFMFIVKFPVFVMHGWLPRAHVEAPTLGSVLLARILLKLGSYGLLRLLLVCFYNFVQLTFSFRLLGALIAGAVCFLQRDCKAFIAISSVSHIRALWAGMVGSRELVTDSAVLVSVSHGFVAGSLFFLIGHLYERRASRSILILREGWSLSTLLIIVWVGVCFINAGLPPTYRFFGEVSVFQIVCSGVVGIRLVLALSGMVGGVFSFSLFDWTSFQKENKQGSLFSEIWLLCVIVRLRVWNIVLIFWS